MPSWLHRLLWRTNVHGGDDLPLTFSRHPSVDPKEPAAFTATALPGLISLGDPGLSIKAHFHLVEGIRDKELVRLPGVGNHFCFVVNPTLWIDPYEVVSQDPSQHGS